MDYIKKFNSINEELKRKLTAKSLQQQAMDARKEREEKLPLDQFTKEELFTLYKDGFAIKNRNEANDIDKLFTFTIKKSLDINDEVLYSLTVTNNSDGKVIYERKIKLPKGTSRSSHHETLDFLVDKCAYILHDLKEKTMKKVDPYDEESWDEEEKEEIVRKMGHDFINKDDEEVGEDSLEYEESSTIICSTCNGSGLLPNYWGDTECPDCEGVGKIGDEELEECPVCRGSGGFSYRSPYGNIENIECKYCNGEGIVDKETLNKIKNKIDDAMAPWVVKKGRI